MTNPHATPHPDFNGDPEAHLPADHNPLPELSHSTKKTIPADAFMAVQDSAEFADLKKRFRNFAFPMTAAFLIWYFAYVLLSVFAKDLMAIPAIGHLNVGMVLGLLQFVTTFLITWLYIRHMNKNIDPVATALRERLEETAR